eukprot:gene9408-12669_t
MTSSLNKIDLGSYGAVNTEEASKFLSDKSALVMGVGKQKLLELKKYAEDGNYTWKVLGFIAGIVICITSLLSLLSHILAPFNAIMDVYLLGFGLLACLLEFKDRLLTQKYLDLIKQQALFLYRPYGRAAFYFFIGVLIVARGGLIGFVAGFYVATVGVAVYLGSRDAYAKLKDVKNANWDDKQIAAKFKEFDHDESGNLDNTELAALCQSLGSKLTLNELESAIFLLDRNANGKIEYDEFLQWYKGQDEMV